MYTDSTPSPNTQSLADTLQIRPQPAQTSEPPIVADQTDLSPSDQIALKTQLQGQPLAEEPIASPNQVNFTPGANETLQNADEILARLDGAMENLPPAERELVAQYRRDLEAARNGDPQAIRRLQVANRLFQMADKNPQKAREIYDLLQRMNNGELSYADLSQRQQDLLGEIGLTNQERIDQLGGLQELFPIIQVGAGVKIDPGQFSQTFQDTILPILERANDLNLYDNLADIHGLPPLETGEIPPDLESTETPIASTEEKEEKHFSQPNDDTNPDNDVMFERQLEEHRQRTKEAQEKLKFQREITDRNIQQNKREYQHTDEHARALRDAREGEFREYETA